MEWVEAGIDEEEEGWGVGGGGREGVREDAGWGAFLDRMTAVIGFDSITCSRNSSIINRLETKVVKLHPAQTGWGRHGSPKNRSKVKHF